MKHMPGPLKATIGVLALTGVLLITKFYNSEKNSVTINCAPTSGRYTKNNPKSKELKAEGYNAIENSDGTESYWLAKVNPEEICGQENVQGISTSGNPKIMERIQGGLRGNLNDREKDKERLRKAGELVTKRDAEIAKFKKDAADKEKKLNLLNYQLERRNNNKNPKKIETEIAEPKKK